MADGARQVPGLEGMSLADLRPVLDVIKQINTELNLRKLIATILDTMVRFCRAGRGTVAIFKGDRFNAEIAQDRFGNELRPAEMGALRTALRMVRDHGKALVVEDARQVPKLRYLRGVRSGNPLSILCLPLCVRSRLIGAVYLESPGVAAAFGPREREVAELLTDHAAIAIENAVLHRQSIEDALTGVFNHAHFESRLAAEVDRARRQGGACGVLILDLDGFKKINDQYGHETGNEVLRDVAYSLASAVRGVRPGALSQDEQGVPAVGRYGGDEFEIVLPGADRDRVRHTAQRLVKLLSAQNFMCGNVRLNLTVTIGGAVFPGDAADSHSLILRADEALFQGKRAGRNGAVLYAPPSAVIPG